MPEFQPPTYALTHSPKLVFRNKHRLQTLSVLRHKIPSVCNSSTERGVAPATTDSGCEHLVDALAVCEKEAGINSGKLKAVSCILVLILSLVSLFLLYLSFQVSQ